VVIAAEGFWLLLLLVHVVGKGPRALLPSLLFPNMASGSEYSSDDANDNAHRRRRQYARGHHHRRHPSLYAGGGYRRQDHHHHHQYNPRHDNYPPPQYGGGGGDVGAVSPLVRLWRLLGRIKSWIVPAGVLLVLAGLVFMYVRLSSLKGRFDAAFGTAPTAASYASSHAPPPPQQHLAGAAATPFDPFETTADDNSYGREVPAAQYGAYAEAGGGGEAYDYADGTGPGLEAEAGSGEFGGPMGPPVPRNAIHHRAPGKSYGRRNHSGGQAPPRAHDSGGSGFGRRSARRAQADAAVPDNGMGDQQHQQQQQQQQQQSQYADMDETKGIEQFDLWGKSKGWKRFENAAAQATTANG